MGVTIAKYQFNMVNGLQLHFNVDFFDIMGNSLNTLQHGIIFWPGIQYLHPQRSAKWLKVTRNNVNGHHDSTKP